RLRCGGLLLELVQPPPPGGHARLRLGQELAVGPAVEERQQRPQGLGGVPEEDPLGRSGAAGAGQLAPHGKLVPTSSRVSASARASSEGRVPSTPMQPVVNGWSSGTAALPGRDLTTGPGPASAPPTPPPRPAGRPGRPC